MVWLLDCFAGGFIHLAVVMSPGCSEFAVSTLAKSSHNIRLKVVGMNCAMIN